MRRSPRTKRGGTREFQFTHPGRGATCISSSRALSTSAFQFTHPGRGATLLPIFQSVLQWFQFTHPGRGATPHGVARLSQGRVSIHAPREGCDFNLTAKPEEHLRFNSRTPGGVRRDASSSAGGVHPSFNSRTPGGVRLYPHGWILAVCCFNSRTPGGVRLRPRLLEGF